MRLPRAADDSGFRPSGGVPRDRSCVRLLVNGLILAAAVWLLRPPRAEPPPQPTPARSEAAVPGWWRDRVGPGDPDPTDVRLSADGRRAVLAQMGSSLIVRPLPDRAPDDGTR